VPRTAPARHARLGVCVLAGKQDGRKAGWQRALDSAAKRPGGVVVPGLLGIAAASAVASAIAPLAIGAAFFVVPAALFATSWLTISLLVVGPIFAWCAATVFGIASSIVFTGIAVTAAAYVLMRVLGFFADAGGGEAAAESRPSGFERSGGSAAAAAAAEATAAAAAAARAVEQEQNEDKATLDEFDRRLAQKLYDTELRQRQP